MPTSKLYERKSCSVTTPFSVFFLKKSKNRLHHVSPLFFKFYRTTKFTSLDKKYQKLQQAKSTHQTSFLSVLLPLRSIQWSLFHFVQQCFCESQLISQTCYRPKQETSSHDTARFKWTLSETAWWSDSVGMCLQEQNDIFISTSVYKSHFSESIRLYTIQCVRQDTANQWLKLRQWKFLGAPCIRDNEHRQCKPLFHRRSFRKKWRKPRYKYLNASFHSGGSSWARFRHSAVQQRAWCQENGLAKWTIGFSDSRVGHDVHWDRWGSVEI